MSSAASSRVKISPRCIKQFKTKISDKGRECTACGLFKVWDDFTTANKSHTKKTSLCKECKKLKRKPRNIEKEKYCYKKNRELLKKTDPLLVKARLIRASLLNRARKFPEIRSSTPSSTQIKEWLSKQSLVCHYSGEEIDLWKMHIDHKVPPFRGGDNSLKNLALSSAKMNSSKGQMTETEFKELLALIKGWEDKGEKLLIRLRQGFM